MPGLGAAARSFRRDRDGSRRRLAHPDGSAAENLLGSRTDPGDHYGIESLDPCPRAGN